MTNFEEKLRQARESSWEKFGKSLTFYIPGMIRTDHMTGKYQAISITGGYCVLQCDHCAGKLLETMIWEIKQKTNLYVSVHCGLLDERTAFDLKAAGVDQALIDVIGDDDTLQRIYHVSFGISRIMSALDALAGAGLEIVPHVVCGLHFGEMQGEKKAVEIISRFSVQQVVVVSVMKIPGTPAACFKMPKAADVADIIAHARLAMPEAAISLGCARERGNRLMEMMAIDAGVNKMALPSEEAVAHAKELGLEIFWQPTCCCVSA